MNPAQAGSAQIGDRYFVGGPSFAPHARHGRRGAALVGWGNLTRPVSRASACKHAGTLMYTRT